MHSTLVTRKMQIKIIMAHYYIYLRIGKMKATAHTIPNVDKDVEELKQELKLHTLLMI